MLQHTPETAQIKPEIPAMPVEEAAKQLPNEDAKDITHFYLAPEDLTGDVFLALYPYGYRY